MTLTDARALRTQAIWEHTLFSAMLAVACDQVSREPMLSRSEALAALSAQRRVLETLTIPVYTGTMVVYCRWCGAANSPARRTCWNCKRPLELHDQ